MEKKDITGGKKPKGLYILFDEAFDVIYQQPEREELDQLVDFVAPQMTRDEVRNNLDVLKDVEVIFSGWGCPNIDEEILEAAPNLKAIFYAAGSVKGLGDKGQLFDRGIVLTSSVEANSIPVAEFCVSQILFSLKLGWHFALKIKEDKEWMANEDRWEVPGCYESTVGIISLGSISRKVIELLKPYKINILVSSGHLSDEEAEKLGVKVATVDEIFKKADVVSLHTPRHKQGVVTGDHIRSMKTRSTFLNTARGACVREKEVIDALKERKDVMALLDVTDPEPPVPGSEIFDLPNIITFPHISGSMHAECRRMARFAIDDFKRFLKGEPLEHKVTKEQWEYMA